LNIYYSGGLFLPEAKYMPVGNIGRFPAGGGDLLCFLYTGRRILRICRESNCFILLYLW